MSTTIPILGNIHHWGKRSFICRRSHYSSAFHGNNFYNRSSLSDPLPFIITSVRLSRYSYCFRWIIIALATFSIFFNHVLILLLFVALMFVSSLKFLCVLYLFAPRPNVTHDPYFTVTPMGRHAPAQWRGIHQASGCIIITRNILYQWYGDA